MPAELAKWKAANLKIEPTENPNEVYLHAPDGIRLEVYGEPALPTPVSMNHIHYNAPDIPAIKAWYVKAFGANPGRRPCIACISRPVMIEAGDFPGVNLSFSGTRSPVGPTKGRSLDHIGFDVIEPRRVRQDARGQGDQNRCAYPAGAKQQGEGRVPERSVGNLHRTDRRARALGGWAAEARRWTPDARLQHHGEIRPLSVILRLGRPGRSA